MQTMPTTKACACWPPTSIARPSGSIAWSKGCCKKTARPGHREQAWYPLQDSNSQPPDPKSGALSIELSGRKQIVIRRRGRQQAGFKRALTHRNLNELSSQAWAYDRRDGEHASAAHARGAAPATWPRCLSRRMAGLAASDARLLARPGTCRRLVRTRLLARAVGLVGRRLVLGRGAGRHRGLLPAPESWLALVAARGCAVAGAADRARTLAPAAPQPLVALSQQSESSSCARSTSISSRTRAAPATSRRWRPSSPPLPSRRPPPTSSCRHRCRPRRPFS